MMQALFASWPRRFGVGILLFMLSLGAVLAWVWAFFPDQFWDTETLIMRLFLLGGSVEGYGSSATAGWRKTSFATCLTSVRWPSRESP